MDTTALENYNVYINELISTLNGGHVTYYENCAPSIYDELVNEIECNLLECNNTEIAINYIDYVCRKLLSNAAQLIILIKEKERNPEGIPDYVWQLLNSILGRLHISGITQLITHKLKIFNVPDVYEFVRTAIGYEYAYTLYKFSDLHSPVNADVQTPPKLKWLTQSAFLGHLISELIHKGHIDNMGDNYTKIGQAVFALFDIPTASEQYMIKQVNPNSNKLSEKSKDKLQIPYSQQIE